MSRRRRISIKLNEQELGKLRGPHGFRLCRWCQKEVHPPRVTFCSDLCVHLWRLRSDVKYLRKFVYERDLGICSKCGTDTRYIRIEIENAARDSMKASGVWYWKDHPIFLGVLKKLKLTVKESEKSLWQADHVLEVADGGGETDLSNIVTLCIMCHKLKTKISAEKRRLSDVEPQHRCKLIT